MVAKTLENKKLSLILFIAVCVLYSLVYMTKNCYSAAMAAIVDEGILTKSQTGFITSVFYIIYAPLQLVGGKMADKYSPEKLIRIGVLGGAVANVVIFINQSYPVMLIAWGMNAAVQFGLWPAVLKIITSNLAHEHRTNGVFYISMAASAGVFLSYTIAAFVDKWQNNFAISAVTLLFCAIFFYMVYNYMEKRMVNDPELKPQKEKREQKLPTKTLVLKTGLLFMIIICVLKEMLNTGIRAFSPMILMESYEHISPQIGNLLNLIIISSGIVGIFVVKTCIYPKLVRNEFSGIILIFSVMLFPVTVALFVGKIDAAIMLIALTLICGIVSCSAFFFNLLTMKFHKYGCDGMVAGLLNAGASFGIVIESYGFAAIAEHFSWQTVIAIWFLICIICIVLGVIGKRQWKKFKA